MKKNDNDNDHDDHASDASDKGGFTSKACEDDGKPTAKAETLLVTGRNPAGWETKATEEESAKLEKTNAQPEIHPVQDRHPTGYVNDELEKEGSLDTEKKAAQTEVLPLQERRPPTYETENRWACPEVIPSTEPAHISVQQASHASPRAPVAVPEVIPSTEPIGGEEQPTLFESSGSGILEPETPSVAEAIVHDEEGLVARTNDREVGPSEDNIATFNSRPPSRPRLSLDENLSHDSGEAVIETLSMASSGSQHIGDPLEAVVVEERPERRDVEEEIRRRIFGGGPQVVDEACVVAIRDNELPSDSRMCWKGAIKWHVAFCAVLLSIVLGIILGLTLAKSRRANPTPVSQRFESLKEVLVQVSGEEALSDPTSPQYQALDWLANHDAYVDSPSAEDPYDIIVQRYALAVLFFATGGPTAWKNKLNFLQPIHECSWWAGGRNPFPLYDPTNQGIVCDEELHVKGILLPENNLVGTIPIEIGEFANLVTLFLPINKLAGSIPSNLYALKNVTNVYLLDNEISGTIDPLIGNMKSLIDLDLHRNRLNGSLPHSIGLLNNLETIHLDRNGLSGSIPSDFQNLKMLKSINVGDNKFSGRIPPLPSSLLMLNFWNNSLTGSIPESISESLPLLERLSLHSNYLNGTIPASITNFKHLLSLDLYGNNLSGTMPRSIGDLRPLEGLSLESNFLSGTIPPSLKNLADGLQILRLGDNILEGTLPPFLGNFTTLNFPLILYYNQFVGTVPRAYLNLADNLDYILLEGNDLTGDVSFLCEGGIGLHADCGGARPEIFCSCCRLCCDKNGENCERIITR